jgi:CMP-N-acetylneuraminic acid synthetase
MHKLVALLPMKANSSRVPGKNFRNLVDKPLFRWILDSLLEIPEVERVVINTDARSILDEKGLPDTERLIVRNRIESLVGDEVSMNRIIQDDIDSIDSEAYLMTHTTNPLIRPSTISKAYRQYQSSLGVSDSLFTVNRFQTRFYRENGQAVNHDPKKLIPTQDLEPWYEENSCLYFFSRSSFMSANARIGSSPSMMETPKLESIDIDEEEDWQLAETLAFQSRN